MLAGYITADGNVLTPILPAGSVVWVRARGEVFGRRPSAWTDAETITLSQTPGLTIVELTLVENESAGCTPHLSWTPNAYAEGLRIRTSVGAFGHTPSYSLWDDVDSDTPLEITLTEIALDPGEEIYVEVTAYPTFSMGSVSGSPGSQYVLRESCEVEEEQDFGFLNLNDTPDSYVGQGGKLVSVKGSEDGVEFVAPSGMPSGTAFPGSPSSGDLFYRTDRNIEYFYDGTRWLSTQIFHLQLFSFVAANATASGTVARMSHPWTDTYDIYVEKAWFNHLLSGSGNWTLSLQKVNTSGTGTQIASSGAFSTTNRTQVEVAVNAVVPTSDNIIDFLITATENSGTATLSFGFGSFTYRLIG